MKIIPIIVNKKSYFLIDENPIKRNYEFLNNLQPLYYHEITKALQEKMKTLQDNSESDEHIAVQIRTIYGQAIETLFAFLFALIQSPMSLVSWLQKYKVSDIKELLIEFNKNKSISYYKLQLLKSGWVGLSETVNNFNSTDDHDSIKIKENFGKLWEILSKEFLNDKTYKEYCNIKHGFRIDPGGFNLLISKSKDIEDSNAILLQGNSKYGSKIYIDEKVKNAPKKLNAFSLRKTYFNWDIDSLCKRIEFISYSINNIISFSKGLMKNDFTQEEYLVPDSISIFQDAIRQKNEINTFDIDVSYNYNDFTDYKFPNVEDYYKEKLIFIPKELLL